MTISIATKEQKQAFFNAGFDPNASGTCYLVTWLNDNPPGYIYRESNTWGKLERYEEFWEKVKDKSKTVNVTGTLVNTIEFCVCPCYESAEIFNPRLAVSYEIVLSRDYTFTVVRSNPVTKTRKFVGYYKSYDGAKKKIFENLLSLNKR